MAIQMRRGQLADYDEDKMVAGEFAVTTDEDTEDQQVYVAFAPGVSKRLVTNDELDSIALTGTPTAPTATSGTSSTQIATTAFVQTELSPVKSDVTDLMAEKSQLMIGKNLFDKSGKRTKITTGGYRAYTDGVFYANASYEVLQWKVTVGEKYAVNYSNTHVCFFSDANCAHFVSGFLSNNANGYTFTIPSGAVAMTCSISTDRTNTFMLQYGVMSTPVYYAFDEGIVDSQLMGDFRFLDGVIGKNLYDNSGKRTEIDVGYYRDYRTGVWASNGSWRTAIFFGLVEDTDFACNKSNVHVCFYSDDYATEYISGYLVNATNGYTFTTPTGTKSMSMSFDSSAATTFQLEYGTSVTDYKPFTVGIYAKQILDRSVLYVGSGGEYTTIQSAINAANSGDCIIIDKGEYSESLDMVGKHLHLIGAGKYATVVKCSGDDYYYPPLEASAGLVENMSFVTTATQQAQGAIDAAYCAHMDWDEEINNTLQFKNCYFESPIRPCVGIGLRENFTLNFTDCKFKSSTYPVYCHEQQASNKTGQRVELINCSIQSTGATEAIHLQESRAYTGNEITILMQRCIAKANGVSGNGIITAGTYPGNQTPTGSHYLNMDGFYLDTMSALNNESILNA